MCLKVLRTPLNDRPRAVVLRNLLGWQNGRLRRQFSAVFSSITASTTLKIAVFAPMPRARGQHGDGGKAGVLAQHSQAIAKVLSHPRHQHSGAHVAEPAPSPARCLRVHHRRLGFTFVGVSGTVSRRRSRRRLNKPRALCRSKPAMEVEYSPLDPRPLSCRACPAGATRRE